MNTTSVPWREASHALLAEASRLISRRRAARARGPSGAGEPGAVSSTRTRTSRAPNEKGARNDPLPGSLPGTIPTASEKEV